MDRKKEEPKKEEVVEQKPSPKSAQLGPTGQQVHQTQLSQPTISAQAERTEMEKHGDRAQADGTVASAQDQAAQAAARGAEQTGQGSGRTVETPTQGVSRTKAQVASCQFDYPKEHDAMQSALVLAGMADETIPWDAQVARRCGWVINGYLLSQDGSSEQCKDPVALRAATQPLAGKATKPESVVSDEWKKVLPPLHEFAQVELKPKV